MPSADEQECRETATRIDRDFPGWMVLWGVYTRQFVAFPLFDAPPGSLVTSYNPETLTDRMSAISRKISDERGYRFYDRS
jgi:hypothetical protein